MCGFEIDEAAAGRPGGVGDEPGQPDGRSRPLSHFSPAGWCGFPAGVVDGSGGLDSRHCCVMLVQAGQIGGGAFIEDFGQTRGAGLVGDPQPGFDGDGHVDEQGRSGEAGFDSGARARRRQWW